MLWYYLTHSWQDKRVHTYPKGICPKVNVIARLEYELAYYDSTVHTNFVYTIITMFRFLQALLDYNFEKNGEGFNGLWYFFGNLI